MERATSREPRRRFGLGDSAVAHHRCGFHDTKVGGDNWATIEAFSEVDDYFDAEPWRPRGQAMVDAVYKHIVEDGAGYVVFPRYFTEDQTRQMREEYDQLFNGGDCVQRPDSDVGVGTIYAAEAYSPAIDAFRADESLRAAAITVMNQSEHGRALLAEGFVEVSSTAFYQNMAACSSENEHASPLCGSVSVSPASGSALEFPNRPRASWSNGPFRRRSGYHTDHLNMGVKSLLYLNDVRGPCLN